MEEAKAAEAMEEAKSGEGMEEAKAAEATEGAKAAEAMEEAKAAEAMEEATEEAKAVEATEEAKAAEGREEARAAEGREEARAAEVTEEAEATELMEEAEAAEDHGGRLPFARGGPIFTPILVGPVTSVPDFKASVLDEFQSLQAELASVGDFEQELAVDELKILTEEQLVEEALKEDREIFPSIDDSLRQQEHSDDGIVGRSISGRELVCSTKSTTGCRNLESPSISKDSCVPMLTQGPDALEKKCKKKSGKKRGRYFDRDSRAAELEGRYLAKVKELAKIKQRQDDDKLAARLHSFSGDCQPTEGETSFLEKTNMKSLRFITCPVKVKSLKQEHVPVYFPEIVLCVEIYDNKYKSRKNQEFLVLGNQTLTELKDRIYCLTDKLMDTAGEYDPSGYFLIEDTFFNDMRDPSSIDYSVPIFNWLENNNKEAVEKWDFIMSGKLKRKQKKLLGDAKVASLPTFKSSDMHRTRFSDLQFRLGCGYLYCHQGNCKHTVVIRDMRLIHPDDVPNQAEYPLLTFQVQPRYRKCSVCKIYIAKKMTVDDKWAPENPCYFCLNCYFLLHYKKDNSLLYPHGVYDYFHE